MIENQPTNLPKMKGDIGFSLGFFCGAVLAAVGVYLTASPEGKKLRTRLTAEFNEHQRNLILASVIPNDKKIDADIPELAIKIRGWIKKLRTTINKNTEKSNPKPINITTKRKHHFKQK